MKELINTYGRESKNNTMMISFFLFFLSAVGISLFLIEFSSTQLLTSALFFLVLFLCSIPFIVAIKQNVFKLEEPIHWITLLYFVFFAGRALYLLCGAENRSGIVFDYYEMVNPMLAVVALGLVSLLSGYYLVKTERLFKLAKAPSKTIDANALFFNVGILFLIGASIQIYYISKGWHTSFEANLRLEEVPLYAMAIGYLQVFSTFAFLFGLALYYSANRPHSMRFFLWGVIFLLEIIFAFLSGAKTRFIPLVIGPILIKAFYEKKVPWLQLFLCLFAIIFFIFPLVNMYREACSIIQDDDVLRRLWLVGGYMANRLSSISILDYFFTSFHTVMNRMAGFDSLALVLKYTPDVMPYQYGKTIIVAPLLLIPTFLWPGKYQFLESVASGVRFGQEYYGIENSVSGVSITQIGELYLNFHLFGIVIGMFLMGILYRFIYMWWTRERDPLRVGAYTMLFTLFVPIEYWFATGYGNLLKQMILLSLVIWVIRHFNLRTVVTHK